MNDLSFINLLVAKLIRVYIFLDEPNAIKLSVYTIGKKKICEVYFCSVNADSLIDNVYEHAGVVFPGMQQTVIEQFTAYPLILCRGNVGPRKLLFEWLQVLLSCCSL